MSTTIPAFPFLSTATVVLATFLVIWMFKVFQFFLAQTPNILTCHTRPHNAPHQCSQQQPHNQTRRKHSAALQTVRLPGTHDMTENTSRSHVDNHIRPRLFEPVCLPPYWRCLMGAFLAAQQGNGADQTANTAPQMAKHRGGGVPGDWNACIGCLSGCSHEDHEFCNILLSMSCGKLKPV